LLFFCSGGIELVVTGQNFDVIQNPLMKSVYNTSVYEFISVSRKYCRFENRNHPQCDLDMRSSFDITNDLFITIDQ